MRQSLCTPLGVAGGAEAPLAANAFGQRLDGDERDTRDRHDDQLRDAIADRDLIGLTRIGIQQRDLDLAAIPRVDCAGTIENRDAVLRGKTTARYDERGMAVRKSDAHAGGDERALSGLQTNSLRRYEVGSGVVRMRVHRDDRRDNGDIHAFGHPTRVMQNMNQQSRSVQYRERLSPSLWSFGAAALAAPMFALILTPVNQTLALVIGMGIGILLIALLVLAAPVVEVSDGMLRAGRAKIELDWLGEPIALTGEDAKAARGRNLSSNAWHLLRGGIDGVVVIPVTDPDDPAPNWVISSRTPERLVAILRRAGVTPSSPRK